MTDTAAHKARETRDGLPEPYYEDDSVTLYHGDCRNLLPNLTGFDLVLADPPYGISWEGHRGSDIEWEAIKGDDGTQDLRFMLTLECRVISFGANNYPNQLPHRGRWICWDKRVNEKADRMLGSPFELAWVNKTSGFDKIYRIMHGGVVNANGGKRVHPTEKPVDLMRQIIEDHPPELCVVDPFAGSGTTLRAAKDLGHKSIGIELDERYCEIAAERLSQGVLDL